MSTRRVSQVVAANAFDLQVLPGASLSGLPGNGSFEYTPKPNTFGELAQAFTYIANNGLWSRVSRLESTTTTS